MAQPPAVPPLPERRVWHRHPIVLIRAVFLPLGGVLTLLVAWAVDGTTNGTWVRAALGSGSVILFWRAAAAITLPRPGAQTPASQRQGVLQRVTAAVRWAMAIVATVLVAAALITVLGSFVSPAFAGMVSVVYFVWLFFILLWLAVNTIDWGNDIYILTHDRIIDQIRFPLLYDQRTEARLDQVQNVRSQQGFWGGLLGFGDVTVETAGRTQAVVFLEVPNPLDIQQTIFRYIDQLNERREAQEAARQRVQLTRWFRAYHTVVGWIEVLDLPEEVQYPRPIHVRWRINLGPEQEYETWLSYDTESDAQGREHANA
ncbi:MAG: PH domain-containing protein, partial [Anaerolineae bacterium]